MSNSFRITNPPELARMWGELKNNPKMTVDKFNRVLRLYYNNPRILKREKGPKNTYTFYHDVPYQSTEEYTYSNAYEPPLTEIQNHFGEWSYEEHLFPQYYDDLSTYNFFY
ncbi:protein C-ets-2-like [Octopus sinensis]|uniref:Protein C-ets-2-like n=1 Tax=Octopus sinensis TaxID=2607531 RepID=A0A6P7TY54_9MOLL|nr:protein C-ets-2-like [Octopus sinensis]